MGAIKKILREVGIVIGSVAIAGSMYLARHSVFAEILKEDNNVSKNNLEVIVLDNNDKDYKNPPFNDNLYLINNNGEVINKINGFNITQTLGGVRSVALAEDGSFVVCENAAKKMSRYDKNGKLVFSIDASIFGSVTKKLDFSSGSKLVTFDRVIDAVDISSKGDLYCLLGAGTIDGESILIIDPLTGEIKKQAKYGGFDLVVDDKHDSVWVVGADIKNLTLDLKERFVIDPIEWTAVSVDYASDGSAWIADRRISKKGTNRLLNVSLEGEVNKTIDLSFSPSCVAVNRNNNDLWVAGGDGVYKYPFDGETYKTHVSDNKAFGVRVNQKDGSVWVVESYKDKYVSRGKKSVSSMVGFEDFEISGGFISHYSKKGILLDAIRVSEDQKFIGVVK